MIFPNCYTKFHEPLGEWNLRQFWNITRGIYAKYHVQIMLLFVNTTTRKRFVIFTCRYFKLSWNTTALRQSNCRIFWCSRKRAKIMSSSRTLVGHQTLALRGSWSSSLIGLLSFRLFSNGSTELPGLGNISRPKKDLLNLQCRQFLT